MIQKAKVPLRAIFQMSSLVFFPVVSTEYKSWKDLNGQPFAFNSRGSATEAYGDVMAAREGIKFGERTYVSGLRQSRHRADERHHQGDDSRPLQQEQGRWRRRRQVSRAARASTEKVSDEILFANAEWLAANQETATIVVEELLKLWREMNENPGIIEEERVKRNLLSDQPAEVIEEVPDYYEEGVEAGIWNPEGAS